MTITEFVAALNEKFGGGFEQGHRFVKYTRIVHRNSVYCFIDAAGNIYKPASWKAPAKGVRSTLATVVMSTVDQFGGWLYR